MVLAMPPQKMVTLPISRSTLAEMGSVTIFWSWNSSKSRRSPPATELQVIVNWFEELKAKVPTTGQAK